MDSANEFMGASILGIFGHGIGHGLTAKAIREQGELPDDGAALSSNENSHLTQAVGLIVFWLFLLNTTMPKISKKVLIPIAAVCYTGQVYVPLQFSFTYVQTVLLLAFSINQLSRPTNEKQFAYGFYPLISGFPIILIGWLESTCCSRIPLRNIGGHLIYDAWIPVSLIGFYLTCYWTGVSKTKVKSA